MTRKEEIIELRKTYLPTPQDDELQKELIAIYKAEYTPQHTKEEYYDVIMEHGVDAVKERHSHDTNYPDTVYECFSVASQHVRGHTKEHCLDQICDAAQRKVDRIKRYAALPTLQELVDSDVVIDPNAMYDTREKGMYEDSCYGDSGEAIIRMREIGVKEYQKEASIEMAKWWGEGFAGSTKKQKK